MSYNFSKVNVLVVESTPEMFQLFKAVLSMLDVPEKNIDPAYSAEEGFEKFCNKNHDIIITDWLENPDKGIQLLTTIRTSEKSPNIFVPVIMTAGSSHFSRVIRSRDAGVSEYLVKPFAANSLATRITRLIEKPRDFVVSDKFTGPDRRVRSIPFDGKERRVASQEN
jgi:two-component system, chemotaxis family, chemotaxis protein CheY